MSRIPEDRSQWKPVHTRKLDIQTYAVAADAIVVEGCLLDNRLHDTYPMTGERRPAGVVHHLILRMRVAGPDLTIEAIEAEFATTPREACPEAQATLDRIRGMCISSGFSEAVKARIGGAAGCAHLTALLLAMAPAAVQGFWAAVSAEPVDTGRYADKALALLTDTCWVWRREGPLMAEFRRRLEEGAAGEGNS